MSLTHGMNIETIRQLAKSFDDQATKVQQLETRINGLVGQAQRDWAGKDSKQFVGEWNNTHRKAILKIIAALTELAKILARNAQAQQETSDKYDGIEGKQTPGSHREEQQSTKGPKGSPLKPVTPPGTSGIDTPLPGADRSWQDVQAAYDARYEGFGLWKDGGPNGENKYQCVSWAWYRMKELGATTDQVQGNGGELATKLGGTTNTVPKPGAIASYSAGDYGHVMFVEQVTKNEGGPLTILISDMNRIVKPGTNVIDGFADEYGTMKFTQNADGTWTGDNGKVRTLTIANPNYQAGEPRMQE